MTSESDKPFISKSSSPNRRNPLLTDGFFPDCLVTCAGHTNDVLTVELGNDPSRFFSGSSDGTIKVWDMKGTCLETFKHPAKPPIDGEDAEEVEEVKINSIAITSDPELIVSGASTSLKVFNFKGTCVATLRNDSTFAIKFCKSRKMIVSAGDDCTIRLWDLKKIGDDDDTMSGSTDTRMSHSSLSKELKGHSKSVRALAVTKDEKTLLSGACDNSIRMWSFETGECFKILTGHSRFVLAVASLPDGRIVSGSHDSTVRLWTPDTGESITFVDASSKLSEKSHASSVRSVAVTSDGMAIISCSYDNTIKIWNRDTGVCHHQLKGHTDNVLAVRVTEDARTVISSSWDKTCKLWKVVKGVNPATESKQQSEEPVQSKQQSKEPLIANANKPAPSALQRTASLGSNNSSSGRNTPIAISPPVPSSNSAFTFKPPDTSDPSSSASKNLPTPLAMESGGSGSKKKSATASGRHVAFTPRNTLSSAVSGSAAGSGVVPGSNGSANGKETLTSLTEELRQAKSKINSMGTKILEHQVRARKLESMLRNCRHSVVGPLLLVGRDATNPEGNVYDDNMALEDASSAALQLVDDLDELLKVQADP